ncbi:helix-turn-helix domain-containing protein [Alkalibacterium sp.]
MAKKLSTTKSAVSRLENHSESVRLATIEKVARVFNKKLVLDFQ